MKFYFTFGSDERYPYGPNDYVEVEAENGTDACELFRVIHPNRPGSDCLNCAFIYSEDTFNKFRDKYYNGIEPVEIISVRKRD